MAAYWNIGLGAVCLIGGLSGRLSLFGTGSSDLLALLGGATLGLGLWQVWKRR